MKRAMIAMIGLAITAIMYSMMTRKAPAPTAQALAPGWTAMPLQAPTNTPVSFPTMSPFPTIDYRATDQAYQLQMEQQRNDMIKVQLAHDEQMLAQQVELARINATAEYAPTQVALIVAQNTLTSGQLTAVSIHATSTAQVPTMIVAVSNSLRTVQNSKRDDIIFVIGAGAVILFLLTGSFFFVRKAKSIKAAEIMHELQRDDNRQAVGLDVTLRDERDQAKSEHYQLPCSMEQLIELAEMVVNGARSFPYNHMESNSRTFKNRRDDLRAVRDVLDKARLVTTNVRTGEGFVSERGVQFFEWVFDNRDLPDGFELGEEVPSPTV